MVVDVKDASLADGARLCQWTENRNGNQLFRLDMREDGWGVVRIKHTEKVGLYLLVL